MTDNNNTGLAASIERHLRAYFEAHEHSAPAAGLYNRVLQEVERPLIALVMEKCEHNQLRAAALLGLNRNTLRKKLRMLDLQRNKPKGRA